MRAYWAQKSTKPKRRQIVTNGRLGGMGVLGRATACKRLLVIRRCGWLWVEGWNIKNEKSYACTHKSMDLEKIGKLDDRNLVAAVSTSVLSSTTSVSEGDVSNCRGGGASTSGKARVAEHEQRGRGEEQGARNLSVTGRTPRGRRRRGAHINNSSFVVFLVLYKSVTRRECAVTLVQHTHTR